MRSANSRATATFGPRSCISYAKRKMARWQRDASRSACPVARAATACEPSLWHGCVERSHLIPAAEGGTGFLASFTCFLGNRLQLDRHQILAGAGPDLDSRLVRF